jgi:hypothetical protein
MSSKTASVGECVSYFLKQALTSGAPRAAQGDWYHKALAYQQGKETF